MRQRKSLKRIGSALLAGLIFATMAVGALADEPTTPVTPPSIIDTEKKGSITIHKYYENDNEIGTGTDTGEERENAPTGTTAANGVEFTCKKVVGAADVINNSVWDDTDKTNKVELVYGFANSDELLQILNMVEKTTTDGNTTYTSTNAYPPVKTDTENNKFYYSSNQLDAAIQAINSTLAGKNALEDYVKNETTTATTTNGVAEIKNLEQGLYLILETKVPENIKSTTNPFFVSIPMTRQGTTNPGEEWLYDVHVYPKNQWDDPTINKQVKNNDDDSTYGDTVTASEGETVYYRIISRIPTIDSTATYLTQFQFDDKLAKGLTYKQDTLKVEIYDKDPSKNTTDSTATLVKTLTKTTDYTATFDTGKNTMSIIPTKTALDSIINTPWDHDSNNQTPKVNMSGYYMVISYEATVNSNDTVQLGDTGNNNKVQLTYKRTNTANNMLDDAAYVFTYGINITKRFEDNKTDKLGEVQFTLKHGEKYVTANTTASSGVYYVTSVEETNETKATKFSPNTTNGRIVINGLEADTYTLTEVKTASGYNLLKKPIVINVTETTRTITPSSVSGIGNTNDPAKKNDAMKDEHENDADATVDGNDITMAADNGSDNALVPIQITNTKGFSLPATGGLGTWALTIIGVIGVAAGAYILKGDKKSKKNG